MTLEVFHQGILFQNPTPKKLVYKYKIINIHRYCNSLESSTDKEKEAPPSHSKPSQSANISRVNPSALPCSECGSQSRKVGAGKVPGGASLMCVCGRFIKWIGINELTAIAGQLKNGGQV
jgi:hypothetical protein